MAFVAIGLLTAVGQVTVVGPVVARLGEERALIAGLVTTGAGLVLLGLADGVPLLALSLAPLAIGSGLVLATLSSLLAAAGGAAAAGAILGVSAAVQRRRAHRRAGRRRSAVRRRLAGGAAPVRRGPVRRRRGRDRPHHAARGGPGGRARRHMMPTIPEGTSDTRTPTGPRLNQVIISPRC